MVDDAGCVMLALATSGLVWAGLDDHAILVENAFVDSNGLLLLTGVCRPGGVDALETRGTHMEVAPCRITGLLCANADTTRRTGAAGAGPLDEGSLSWEEVDGPKKDQAQGCECGAHCCCFERGCDSGAQVDSRSSKRGERRDCYCEVLEWMFA